MNIFDDLILELEKRQKKEDFKIMIHKLQEHIQNDLKLDHCDLKLDHYFWRLWSIEYKRSRNLPLRDEDIDLVNELCFRYLI